MADDGQSEFDVFNDLKNTGVEQARAAASQKDYQERIQEKDAEGEAGVRHQVRLTQSMVIHIIGWCVCGLVIMLAVIAGFLSIRYAAFIWGDTNAIRETLSKVIEWFLVALSAMFVKSRLFKD